MTRRFELKYNDGRVPEIVEADGIIASTWSAVFYFFEERQSKSSGAKLGDMVREPRPFMAIASALVSEIRELK